MCFLKVVFLNDVDCQHWNRLESETGHIFVASARITSLRKKIADINHERLSIRAVQSFRSAKYLVYSRTGLDVEIVRQTAYLLLSQIYQADFLRLFHRIIDHWLLTSESEQCLKDSAFIDTCRLYEQRFDEQYCSFTIADRIEKSWTHICSELPFVFGQRRGRKQNFQRENPLEKNLKNFQGDFLPKF